MRATCFAAGEGKAEFFCCVRPLVKILRWHSQNQRGWESTQTCAITCVQRLWLMRRRLTWKKKTLADYGAPPKGGRRTGTVHASRMYELYQNSAGVPLVRHSPGEIAISGLGHYVAWKLIKSAEVSLLCNILSFLPARPNAAQVRRRQ